MLFGLAASASLGVIYSASIAKSSPMILLNYFGSDRDL